jgi:endo-beta-N-acetylglucosaminidase D
MRHQFEKRAGVVLRAAVAAVAVGGLADAARAQVPGQPYASYWHPSTILNWNPATDPDAAFNRSNVPLAARISTVQNVNANVTPAPGVTSLVAYGPTSNNPSQGSRVMKYYATNYWQYMDNMVFWGGSASEGLILAPNAPVIDAAHRNGVRVLGTCSSRRPRTAGRSRG